MGSDGEVIGTVDTPLGVVVARRYGDSVEVTFEADSSVTTKSVVSNYLVPTIEVTEVKEEE